VKTRWPLNLKLTELNMVCAPHAANPHANARSPTPSHRRPTICAQHRGYHLDIPVDTCSRKNSDRNDAIGG